MFSLDHRLLGDPCFVFLYCFNFLQFEFIILTKQLSQCYSHYYADTQTFVDSLFLYNMLNCASRNSILVGIRGLGVWWTRPSIWVSPDLLGLICLSPVPCIQWIALTTTVSYPKTACCLSLLQSKGFSRYSFVPAMAGTTAVLVPRSDSTRPMKILILLISSRLR